MTRRPTASAYKPVRGCASHIRNSDFSWRHSCEPVRAVHVSIRFVCVAATNAVDRPLRFLHDHEEEKAARTEQARRKRELAHAERVREERTRA